MKRTSRAGAKAVALAGVFVTGLLFGYSHEASAGAWKTAVKTAKAETGHNVAAGVGSWHELVEKLEDQITNVNKTFDSYFDDELLRNAENPFKLLDEVRDEMRSQFKSLDSRNDLSFSDALFDVWFNDRFGGNYSDIKRKEDKKYVYYQFKVDNPEKYEFTARVENGRIELSAEDKTVSKEEKKGYESKTVTEYKLERSFPLPKNVNTNRFETSIKGDQYIVKFPKTT